MKNIIIIILAACIYTRKGCFYKMRNLLVFLAFLCVALGSTPSMSNALRNQVLVDFKNAIIPSLSKQLEHITLEQIKGKKSHIRYNIYNIEIHVNPIDPQKIGIQFVKGSTLRFTGSSIGMQGTAKAKTRLRPFRKTFDVRITVSDASFSIDVALKIVNGKPNIEVRAFDFNLATHNVNIKISGGILGKIVNLVVKLMKGHVVKGVVKQIRNTAPKLITNRVNKMLNGLRDSIRIDKDLYMSYQFPTAPVIKDDFLLTGIVAYLHPVNDTTQPPGPVSPVPQLDKQNSKGIQFFVSDYVVKSALHSLYKLKRLMTMHRKIKDHPVAMNCSLNKLPDFRFHNAINASASVTCDTVLDNNADSRFQVSADFQFALKERIENATVYFKIDKFTFSKLEFKMLKPLNNWFKTIVNEVVATAIEIVNERLGERGIPLPAVKEIDYNDTSQYIGDGYMMIATNPIFKIREAESLPEVPKRIEDESLDDEGETLTEDEDEDETLAEGEDESLNEEDNEKLDSIEGNN
eukprot:TRINITY_DN2000_c0_g2_i15.p1 TRINITY_DN2000_c0_g2~~TRINITY_DN2000_c0_g2_i15.p1  ORF type:complete len:520 (-),score=95.94 TRINITY_DN2000_c0_g2_i15:135-1694(-)